MRRFALVACRWAILTNLVATPLALAVVVHAAWKQKIPLHAAALIVCFLAFIATLGLAIASATTALIEKKRSE
jgi:hypothetical protein